MKNSNCSGSQKIVRFISTIIIIFVHLGDSIYDPSSPFLLLTSFGYLCVGAFFFFAGKNMIISFNREHKVKKGYLFDKVVKVLIPAGAINILYGLIINYYSGRMQMIKWGLLVNLANPTLWFVSVILCVYVIFWAIFSACSIICRKTDKEWIVTVLELLSMYLVFKTYSSISGVVSETIGVQFLQGQSKPICLALGMLYALVDERVAEKIIGIKYFVSIPLAFLCGLFHCLNMNGYYVSCLFTYNLYDYFAPVFFTLSLYFLFLGCDTKSRTINKISDMSLEIYVVHFFFLKLFRTKLYIGDDSIYMLVYLVSVYAGAYVLNGFKKICIKIVDKIKMKLNAS